VILALRGIEKLARKEEETASGDADIIVLHDWPKYMDGKRYRRTLTVLGVSLIQLPLGLYSQLDRVLPPIGSPSSPWIVGGSFFANMILIAALTGHQLGAATVPRSLRAKGMLDFRRRVTAAACVVAAVAFALVGYYVFGLAYGIWAGVSIAILGAMTVFSAPKDLAHVQEPRVILRNDLISSILYGAAFGSLQVLVLTGTLGWAMAICLGLSWVLSNVYASAFGKYLIAVFVSRTSFYTPMRLGAFLSWAGRAGLVRRSGVGYQFRHAGLRRYLRELDNEFPV
jgi:hypothetical protein